MSSNFYTFPWSADVIQMKEIFKTKYIVQPIGNLWCHSLCENYQMMFSYKFLNWLLDSMAYCKGEVMLWVFNFSKMSTLLEDYWFCWDKLILEM